VLFKERPLKIPASCWAAMLPMAVSGVPLLAGPSCESLASLAPPGTKITLAQSAPAGTFAPRASLSGSLPPGDMTVVPYKDLPTFCRVEAMLTPSNDSDIKIEVWLPPASAWNGKFMGIGNGGWGGRIYYDRMGLPLTRGYAVAATDTGHQGVEENASFALGHPEKLIDYGYRAVHEMTVKAKAIIAAYYGEGPKLSYWEGCSCGGKQALTEAQRFPADFDGIIAGAPSNYMTHQLAQIIWVAQAVHKDEASYIPPEKYPAIHNAVLAACDALDGVKDDLLEDPTRCKFDPIVLECKGSDGPACLTAPQVEAARKIYAPATNPRTKQQIYPGFVPGSELGWARQAGPRPGAIPNTYWQYVIFKDPNWDYKTLNFDSDVARADQIDNGTLNATDPNLKAFFARGGKLLHYHGWADPALSPLNSVNYYKSVLDRIGNASKVRDSYRLFMVPGMVHCRNPGSEGPNNFDMISAIERWVEKGKAPDQIVASHMTKGNVDRTRPLCSYPEVATYRGTGSTDDAANFSCSVLK
jgi:feruloyl esterase